MNCQSKYFITGGFIFTRVVWTIECVTCSPIFGSSASFFSQFLAIVNVNVAIVWRNPVIIQLKTPLISFIFFSFHSFISFSLQHKMSSSATPPAPQLPPISMFTSRSPAMPASPPSSYDTKHLKSMPILPKPSDYYSQTKKHEQQAYYNTSSTYPSRSHTPPPSDQNTLWALFSQFQQHQQQRHKSVSDQRPSEQPPPSSIDNYRRASDPSDGRAPSSEEVLAEKRRRNAGASARFRDRRKQRERELQDKCNELEQRSKEFENALKRIDPDHPLFSKQPIANDFGGSRSTTSSPPPHHEDHTLFDRVGQLEHLMTRFRQEKETDTQKLSELEKEVKFYLAMLPFNHVFI